MSIIRTILRTAVRFFIIWVVSALALIVANFLPIGITIHPVDGLSIWPVALAAALVLGLVNVLIRPLILLLALPLGFFALFIVALFVNAVTLRITALLFSDGLDVAGWLSAFIGGVVIGSAISLISAILGIGDTGSFYESIIERRLRAQRDAVIGDASSGLVMLEIDGLSYHHITRAVAAGYMPNVAALIKRQSYALSLFDCGLPSQTSACQAGILFGDNYDIPAFRWYDKAQGRLFVSGRDAAAINARFAGDGGLLRGGASIGNLVDGDAAISLLTAADLRGGTPEQKLARAHDIYLLLLNPDFFMRVVGLYIGETLLEVWQYLRDVLTDTRPRLNRLNNFYPFVRASATVFMREVTALLTGMQIVRGEPAIYTTWPGYDEVAHHSGPWSRHALGTLRGFDRTVGSIRRIIATKAPRPYELILLSDHGQSFGATFRMRYGYTLETFIHQRMPAGTVMAREAGGDDGSQVAASAAAELGNVREQGMGGRVGQATTRQLQRAVERGVPDAEQAPAAEPAPRADVTFCASGNLGQVYFHAFPHRATLGELNAAFPGLVDEIAAHEGVGFVVGLGAEGRPIAIGKDGTRDLATGDLRGGDPLAPYGDPTLRAWQVRRVADFPSAGDLIIMSAIYPDGTVAAFEELIGNHGGLGGEQTDAFILHPADWVVPPTRSATDLFPVLDARRERVVPQSRSAAPRRERDDWSLSNLAAGLRDVGAWVELAFYGTILDRAAYRAIATQGAMTGPAILLSLAGVLVSTLMETPPADAAELARHFLTRYGLWVLAVLLIQGAAHVLRGKANFTQTFRVMGFAEAASLLGLLGLLPLIGPFALTAASILSLFVSWLSLSEAHGFRGRRTLLLPVLYFVVVIAGDAYLSGLAGGFKLALDVLMGLLRP
ncbi:MAG TPA: phage holin family protein [Promineifilum sp.]|nr:phage holin family protein [Promineifilum sp.]HRO91640.1 phage holin family protein [Promineifilum sp.]